MEHAGHVCGKGAAVHRTGTCTPLHLWRHLSPNYDEHRHWQVKGSPRVRAIELIPIVETYPKRAL